jgi:hypothetical protein
MKVSGLTVLRLSIVLRLIHTVLYKMDYGGHDSDFYSNMVVITP